MQFIDNYTSHQHCHVWVWCFNTTKNMILCMSLILIHMSYFLILLYCCTICAVLNHYLFQEFFWLPVHLAQCHHFSSEKNNISKGKYDILVMLILLFHFFVFWCWNFVTWFYIQKFYCIYFHYWIFILQISHNFMNLKQTNIDLLIQRFFSFFLPKMVSLNIVLFMFLSNIFVPLLLIAQ